MKAFYKKSRKLQAYFTRSLIYRPLPVRRSFRGKSLIRLRLLFAVSRCGSARGASPLWTYTLRTYTNATAPGLTFHLAPLCKRLQVFKISLSLSFARKIAQAPTVVSREYGDFDSGCEIQPRDVTANSEARRGNSLHLPLILVPISYVC